jgi:Domain of unknown function (DUF389)
MAATVILTWTLTALGLLNESMLIAERPLTSFIWKPDALSWIVGFLAGIAGMLALTSAKSGALVGVLISVMTIPAAANVAVAIAYWVPSEAIGSAIQLMINVSAIAVADPLTEQVREDRFDSPARVLIEGYDQPTVVGWRPARVPVEVLSSNDPLCGPSNRACRDTCSGSQTPRSAACCSRAGRPLKAGWCSPAMCRS